MQTPLLLNIPSPHDATQIPDFNAEFSRQNTQAVPLLQSAQSAIHSEQIPFELNLPFGHPSKHDETFKTFPVLQAEQELLSPPLHLVQAASQTSHLPVEVLENLFVEHLKS